MAAQLRRPEAVLDGAEKVNSAGLHFSSSFTLSLGKIATKVPPGGPAKLKLT